MMRTAFLSVLLTTLLTGCGADEGWSRLEQSLTAEQEQQSRRAVQARDAMFKQLFAQLQGAMKAGGPAKAIGVCRTAAPEIAAAVGSEHKLTIGRTALKLRNPANAAPDWAKTYVEKQSAEPVQLAHADGRFAALLPIHLKLGCLGCHGPSEEIQPAVRQALAEQYPDDQATGFAKGDLRGWFWVEVPAP